MKNKYSFTQLILTVVFVSAFLVSNIVTAKQIQLPLGLSITGGIFVFPITYILSDVFSEVYGYKWSRVTCYLAFAMNLFMSLIFVLVISCASPVWYADAEAFATTLGSTPRILFASLTAFVLGDFVNDKVFAKMKGNKNNRFGVRAIVSSVCGALVDSLIFFPVAFIGTMTVENMLITAATQTALKVIYELVFLPLTIICVNAVKNKENIA